MNHEVLRLHEKILHGLCDIELPTEFENELLECYLNASSLIRNYLLDCDFCGPAILGRKS